MMKKILLVFDFDLTITRRATYRGMYNTLKDQQTVKDLKKSYPNFCEFSEALLKQLKEEGVDGNKLKESIEKLEMNDKFKDLFSFLDERKQLIDIMIISGTVDILIKWILEYNGILHLVSDIYAHKGSFDQDNYLKFHKTEIDDCAFCKYGLCKGVLFKHVLEKKEYEKIAFVADGLNDFCACTHLKTNDILFARKDFELHTKLCDENIINSVPYEVIAWDHGKNIIDRLETYLI